MRARLRSVARVAFGVVGVGFMVAAFAATWDRSSGVPISRDPADLGGALVTYLVGLAAAYRAWLTLLAMRSDRTLARGFALAQLGKYVPGAVWQAVGQVESATRPGTSAGRASVAFLLFAGAQVAAGGLVAAAGAATLTDVDPVLRVVLAGSALAVLGMWRPLTARPVRAWMRRRGTDTGDVELVPPQRALVVAVVWSCATHLANGVAFTLLTPASLGTAFVLVPALAAAWTIGFLALPFPAGLGVREGVLVLLAGPVLGAPGAIAGSVGLRLVSMAAEAVGVAATQLSRLRPARADH